MTGWCGMTGVTGATGGVGRREGETIAKPVIGVTKQPFWRPALDCTAPLDSGFRRNDGSGGVLQDLRAHSATANSLSLGDG